MDIIKTSFRDKLFLSKEYRKEGCYITFTHIVNAEKGYEMEFTMEEAKATYKILQELIEEYEEELKHKD